MRLRAFLLGAALLALFGVVLLRAAKVQLLDRSRLARLQRDQSRRELEWAPRRGVIVDRRGEPRAVTQDFDSVFADPSAFETPRARQVAAARIAVALRLDRARVLEKLAQPDRRFVWIKRRIDEASARRVRGLAIDGIELVKEPKRFYPQRELAGHVLGFVGDESGQEGLERELEQHLRGRSAQVQATRDARGTMVLEHGAPDPADLTGATVTLTLDSAIELAAEKELARAVKASGAIGGWAVVLDVNTGAVLALAGNPAFDANKPGRDPMVWRDRAVQDQLEPGSTIKSFVVARALEEGVLHPDEARDCEHGVGTQAGRRARGSAPRPEGRHRARADGDAGGGGGERHRDASRAPRPPRRGQDGDGAKGRSDPRGLQRQAALELPRIRAGGRAQDRHPGGHRRARRKGRGGGRRHRGGAGVGRHRTRGPAPARRHARAGERERTRPGLVRWLRRGGRSSARADGRVADPAGP